MMNKLFINRFIDGVFIPGIASSSASAIVGCYSATDPFALIMAGGVYMAADVRSCSFHG